MGLCLSSHVEVRIHDPFRKRLIIKSNETMKDRHDCHGRNGIAGLTARPGDVLDIWDINTEHKECTYLDEVCLLKFSKDFAGCLW